MQDIGRSKDFLEKTAVAQTQEKYKNEIRSGWEASAQQKGHSEVKSEPTDWENIIANYTYDKGLLSQNLWRVQEIICILEKVIFFFLLAMCWNLYLMQW